MNNINRIIKEEINKFIISENVNSLAQFSSSLNTALEEYAREMGRNNVNALNNDLKQYIRSFETYVVQIIHAINRCVQSNSLNEGFGNWGINIPPELGGNFWNDAKRGFYVTRNFLRGGRYGGRTSSKPTTTINQNRVSSVRLSVLLNNLSSHQNNFNVKNTQYGIDRMTRQPRNILFNILPQLQSTYNNLINTAQNQNAQGQNP